MKGTLRPAAASARWALRAYGASTTLIVVAGTLAVAAALPVVSLGGPDAGRLQLPPIPDAGLSIGWSAAAATPTALQLRGLALLGGILLGLAIAALTMAVITVLALSADRASARRSEMVVRRAVGSSRRQLRTGGFLEGAAMAALVAGLAVPVGLAGARWALATWPGSTTPGAGVGPLVGPIAAVFGLAAMILLGALLSTLVIPRTPRPVSGGAHPLGHIGRTDARCIGSVEIGAAADQILDDPGAVEHRRDHQRGAPVGRRAFDIGAVREQQLDHRQIALEGGACQRRLSVAVAQIRIGAMPKQHAHRFQMSVIRGEHQQAVAAMITQVRRQAFAK